MPTALISLVALLVMASGADAFEGRVLGPDGRPLAGAQVTILGRTGAVVTNGDGQFQWTPDPAPPFEILVVGPGGVYMKPVLIEQLSEGVLEIKVAPFLNEVVTVSGSAASIVTAPAAGTATLASTEIQTRRPANLMQALENVAGVSQVSEGQAAVPAIRGLARGRTLILLDGARVSSERRVGPSGTYLDPEIIEGIDVARGPGSVAYGSDAFGGVISVRTRTVPPGAPFGARFSGSLGAGVPDHRAALELSKGFEGGSVLFATHTRDADDYDGPDGEVFNSGFEDHGFLGRATYELGGGLLSAGWQSDFGRNIERPRNNSQTVRFYYPTEDSHRFTASYDLREVVGFSRVMFTGFAGSYSQVTDQDRFPTATTARSIERADVSANDFHLRGSAERLFGTSRLEVGVDLNGRYGLRALDIIEAYNLDGTLARATENVSIDSARRTDTGVYVMVEGAVLPALSLAGGVRGDYVTTRNEGGFFGDRDAQNGAGSGFIAVTAGSFNGFSATAQLSRGFRDPVLSDRYFRGPSGRGFITGNPDLEPETSLQTDLGLRYTGSQLRAATYFYNYRIDDLIERYTTATDVFFFRNRGRARVRGFEAEAQASMGWGLSLEGAFQVARGRALDDDSYLDDISPETFSLQLRKTHEWRGLFWQVRTAWFAEDTRSGPTERIAPGSTLLDGAVGVTLLDSLDLRLLARNLLNDDYLASQDVRAIPAPGRSVALSATVRIGRR